MQADRQISCAVVKLLPDFTATLAPDLAIRLTPLCLRWLAVRDDSIRWVTPNAVEARSCLVGSLQCILSKIGPEKSARDSERALAVCRGCVGCVCDLLGRSSIETPTQLLLLSLLDTITMRARADVPALRAEIADRVRQLLANRADAGAQHEDDGSQEPPQNDGSGSDASDWDDWDDDEDDTSPVKHGNGDDVVGERMRALLSLSL